MKPSAKAIYQWCRFEEGDLRDIVSFFETVVMQIFNFYGEEVADR